MIATEKPPTLVLNTLSISIRLVISDQSSASTIACYDFNATYNLVPERLAMPKRDNGQF